MYLSFYILHMYYEESSLLDIREWSTLHWESLDADRSGWASQRPRGWPAMPNVGSTLTRTDDLIRKRYI